MLSIYKKVFWLCMTFLVLLSCINSPSWALEARLSKLPNDILFELNLNGSDVKCLNQNGKFYSLSKISETYYAVAYVKRLKQKQKQLKKLNDGSTQSFVLSKIKALKKRISDRRLLCKKGWQEQDNAPESGSKGAIGEQRIAIVLFNADPSATNLSTPEEYHYAMFDSPYSVNSYFKEVSNQKLWLSGRVFDWRPLNLNNDTCNNLDYSYFLEKVSTFLKFAEYDRIIFVVNFKNGCPGTFGRSTLGKIKTQTSQGVFKLGLMQIFANRVWNTNNSNYAYEPFSVITPNSTFAHELGHNILNVTHANNYQCPTGTLSSNNTQCKSLGATDPFDLMGSRIYASYFNSCFRHKVGWLESDRDIINVKQSGTYRLYPSADPNRNLKALRISLPISIPTGQVSISSLHIEFKAPIGREESRLWQLNSALRFISQTSHADFAGRLLLVRGGYSILNSSTCDGTFLFDMTPDSIMAGYDAEPSSEFLDAALQVGQSWSIPMNNISIKNLGFSDDGGVDVQVTYE